MSRAGDLFAGPFFWSWQVLLRPCTKRYQKGVLSGTTYSSACGEILSGAAILKPTVSSRAGIFTCMQAQANAETEDTVSPPEIQLNDLIPDLYCELRRLARSYLRSERPNHTLQPTALVHEAYLKLLNQHKVDWQNRAQVIGTAAQLMRRVLAGHAERRNAEKRVGSRQQITLDLVQCLAGKSSIDFLEIDQILTRLTALDARQGRVAELRLFGGLSSREIAEVVHVSTHTVERDWGSAKLWLARELSRRVAG